MELHNIITAIRQAELEHIQILLDTLIDRYRQLYPDWEIVCFTRKASADETEQEMVEDILRKAYRAGKTSD